MSASKTTRFRDIVGDSGCSSTKAKPFGTRYPSSFQSSSSSISMSNLREREAVERSIGLGREKIDCPDCRVTAARRPNWRMFRATRRSVSKTSSALEPVPHPTSVIARSVMAQNRVRMRSTVLKGDFQNCFGLGINMTEPESRETYTLFRRLPDGFLPQ